MERTLILLKPDAVTAKLLKADRLRLVVIGKENDKKKLGELIAA